ncbi:hypothetical protein AB0L40_01585, partial [Patulibacter sp. NPDC049589]
MIRSLKSRTVAIAAVGVLGLGAGGVAYAATSSSGTPTPLTGGITDKASDAVLAKYPGSTLVGIESRPDGTFEARVRKADGTQAQVTLDKDFQVTATHEGGFGRGGHGGFGGGPGGPPPTVIRSAPTTTTCPRMRSPTRFSTRASTRTR